MDGLEVRSITVASLPDLVSPCILAGSVGSRLNLDSDSANDMTRTKLGFFHERLRKGAAAMGAYRGRKIVGLLEYYPIEVAPVPVIGNDLFVINCLQVPQVENRELVEKELVAACVRDWSSRKGVVVLGRAKAWDQLGFEEVTRDAWPEGDELVLWLMKFWEVEEPKLAAGALDLSVPRGRIRVDIFECACCPWDSYVAGLVRRAAEELGPRVLLESTDMNSREAVLRHGLTAGIAINGDFQPWLRPHPIPTYERVRARLEDFL